MYRLKQAGFLLSES